MRDILHDLAALSAIGAFCWYAAILLDKLL